MSPTDAVKLVDHASAMSDRWLFLAMLLIVICGGVIIIKYLVKQNESQRVAHSALMEKVLNVVFEATAVMRDVKNLLESGRGKAGLWLASGLAAMFVSACTTVTSPDGQRVTRVDPVVANGIGRAFGGLLTGYLQSQGVPVNYDMIVTGSGKQIVPFE